MEIIEPPVDRGLDSLYGQHHGDRRRRAAQAVHHDPGLGQAEDEIADDLRACVVGVEGENGGAGLQMHGRLRTGLGP